MFYEPEACEIFSPERPYEGVCGMNICEEPVWVPHFPAYIPNFRGAVKDWLAECVRERLINPNDKAGCHIFWLPSPDGHDVAIVLGYNDEDCLCVKIAHQTRNNIMQCDYGIDWSFPYDTKNDEVLMCESSVNLSNTDSAVDWLLDCYLNMTEENFIN